MLLPVAADAPPPISPTSTTKQATTLKPILQTMDATLWEDLSCLTAALWKVGCRRSIDNMVMHLLMIGPSQQSRCIVPRCLMALLNLALHGAQPRQRCCGCPATLLPYPAPAGRRPVALRPTL